MTVAFDFVAALVGLRPPDAATKSKRPAFSKPGRDPLKIRGELSRQAGPALTSVGRSSMPTFAAAAEWSTRASTVIPSCSTAAKIRFKVSLGPYPLRDVFKPLMVTNSLPLVNR